MDFEDKWKTLFRNYTIFLGAALTKMGEEGSADYMELVGQWLAPSYAKRNLKGKAEEYTSFLASRIQALGSECKAEENSIQITKCGLKERAKQLKDRGIEVEEDIFCKGFCGNFDRALKASGVGLEQKLEKMPEGCRFTYSRTKP